MKLCLPGGVDALQKDNFDAKDYVETLLEYYPLDRICTTLSDHVSRIQNKLITIVNSHHEDLVKIAADLRKITQHIPVQRREVQHYLSLSKSLYNSVGATLEDIQKRLCSLHVTHHHILKEKIVLLLLSTLQSDTHVLSVLKDPQQIAMATFNPALCNCLWIMSSDVAFSTCFLNDVVPKTRQVQHSPQMLTPEMCNEAFSSITMDAYEESLEVLTRSTHSLHDNLVETLCRLLRHELQRFNHETHERTHAGWNGILLENCHFNANDSLHHLSFALVILHQHDRVRSLIQEVIIDPYIKQTLNLCGFEEALSQVGGYSLDMRKSERIYDFICVVEQTLPGILRFLAHMFTPVYENIPLDHRQQWTFMPFCSVHDPCVAYTCILEPLLQVLQETFSVCFTPIFPELFNRNFNKTHTFLDTLMSAVLTEQERQKFLESSQWINFTTQWKTKEYEIQRCQQCVRQLRTKLKMEHQGVLNAESLFYLEASHYLMSSVSHLLNPQACIQREYPRLLKCVAQMTLVDYGTFLASHVLDPFPLFEAHPDHRDFSAIQWRVELPCVLMDLVELESHFSHTHTTSLHKEPTVLSRILQDVKTQHLSSQWIGARSQNDHVTASMVTARESAASRCCLAIAKELSVQRQNMMHIFSDTVLHTIREALQAIRGIPPLYRMINRKFTGDTSTYVHAASVPLQCLTWLRGFDQESITECVDTVIDRVLDCYEATLSSVLATLTAQEESLRRLHCFKQQNADSFLQNDVASPLNLHKSREELKHQLLHDATTFLDQWVAVSRTFTLLERPGLSKLQHLLKTECLPLGVS